MILHEINQKMPIYRDCTLGEILFVGSSVFIVESILLALIARLVFGYGSIGLILTLVSFFYITKFLLHKLQKLKYGKPFGYYKQLTVKKLSEMGLMKSPYLIRIGKWSVRREIK